MSETHGERMLRHMLRQFDDKTVITAVMTAIGEELDEITVAAEALRNDRWIDTGEGAQLDGIGTLVDQSRQINGAVQIAFFGFEDQPNAQGFEVGRFRDSWETWLETVNLSDPEYRLALWSKVWKHSSKGYAEDTIYSAQLIFNTTDIRLEEMGNARIRIGVGRVLAANELTLAKAMDLLIRGGGVKLDGITNFTDGSYFGFLDQPNALGFEEGSFADSVDF